MSTGMIVISAVEIVVVAFTVWCIFNEDKLVDFEKKIFAKIKKK